MEPNPSATAQAPIRSDKPLAEVVALPKGDGAVLRRRSEPESLSSIGPSAAATVAAFNRVRASSQSEVLLMWPQRPDGIAVFHALAALNLIGECDHKGLATLFFPWNRNTAGTQRTLLVDRDYIYRATLPALNRVSSERFRDPSSGYLLALHSVKHLLSSGKKHKRLTRALEDDPGLAHPTLFEIMPQHGVQGNGLRRYDDQFLRRLRRHTWISECREHIEAASDPLRTPFFLFGVDADALHVSLFRDAGLDPNARGRRPDIILIDMTWRARNRIENTNWREALSRFSGIVHELYGSECPPVLAITDDVFILQALRCEIVREYDIRRGISAGDRRSATAQVILSPESDPLDQETIAQSPPPSLTAEVYGTDILRVVDSGIKLRRSLADAGDNELADAVTAAVNVIQNLIGLPGQPQQFYQFLTDNSDGAERQRVGARFDHQAPRSKITSALKSGLAGANHDALSGFLSAFDELCRVADVENPGRRRFDDCVRSLVHDRGRSIVVFPGEVQRGFAEWRIENDPVLADVRTSLGQQLLLLDRREVNDELDRNRDGQEPFQRVVFVEPNADDLLQAITRPCLPNKVTVLANLARSEQTLRRIRLLLSIDGIDKVRDKLTVLQRELERALGGHTMDIADLDAELPLHRLGMLDLTSVGVLGAGAIRTLRASGNLTIRAFDGSEVALFDPEALQSFSRKLAKDLRPGDQICAFSPDFVSMARTKLNLRANASEVLSLYHKAVADAAQNLPGGDIMAKTAALRERMLKLDPTLASSLPSVQAMKYWIEVLALIGKPLYAVRPQAPRDPKHYLCFMKELGISEQVARHYWELGIAWTRSKRISTGASFHQVFMSILIDPYGTVSRLSEERRREIWQIYDAAQDHIVTVLSNEEDGGG